MSNFDRIIEWLLIALLAFMPLAFGAVEAWSELVVVTIAAAMVICLAAKLIIRKDTSFVWTWAYVPLVLFLSLVFLQLIPLPAELVRLISPSTAGMKSSLLGDLPDAGDVLQKMTITFYATATKHDLRLILVAAAVFMVVINVYRRADQIKRLLGAVALIGGALALLALAQNLFGDGRIYWLVPSGHATAQAGTFVNHSHFGQFMNLSIGAALGLLLVKLHEIFGGHAVTPPEVVGHLGQKNLRVVWYITGMIVIGATTIFLSLTRGGMVSMLIAGSFTAVALASKRALGGRGWVIMVMALMAFVCVLYIGFDAVYDRLATLRGLHEYGGRWQIVKDLSRSVTRFPRLGTGLGTHEVVYPMFDRSTVPSMAQYAENEYAQAAEETGIIGLILILAFAGIVWSNYARSVRHSRLPIRAAAFGLGFGLLAIMIHSFSDFGQHLPANACLTAVTSGLLVGLARMGRPGEKTQKSRLLAALDSRPIRVVGASGVVAAFLWAVVSAHGARIAEAEWRQALQVERFLRESDWQGSNDDYKALLTHAYAALNAQPESVHYRHWFNVYRWRSISRARDPETNEVLVIPETLALTRQIVADLHRARSSCPTFGAAYCVAGQLEKFILDDPAGAEHIRTGYRLAPCDATACYVAGLLDAREGRVEDSLPKFRRSLKLRGRFFRDIANVYVQANRPDLAVEIARDSAGQLLYVANILQKMDGSRPLAAQAKAEALAMLQQQCQQPDVSAGMLASLANVLHQEKDYGSAIEYYKRALALEYGQVGWRLALARLLAETGQVQQAMHEARICLRLRPQMSEARRLIADVSLQPGVVPEE